MKQHSLKISFTEYEGPDTLDQTRRNLMEKAVEAAAKAYAPYSSYQVGAAALLENGEIICGNNQENAAYPSGLCAERVALFYAGSKHPDLAVLRLAIAALRDGELQSEPISPCGGCRQVMWEKESTHEHDMEVILCGAKRIRVVSRASALLPLPFAF
ncbi:MAG: cytidine deaminase [Bacteroidetes bacterium]|nr:MAG: cytidine deaminase [Bacteroidota bacterium]